MKIDVDEKYVMQITMMLKMYLPAGVRVFVCGARAKGAAKLDSDLNLAVDYSGKALDPSLLSKLSSAFEDSEIPFWVEIVDLNTISEGFLNNIKGDLVELGVV